MFSWRLQIETTIAIQPKIWEKMSICDCLDLTKLIFTFPKDDWSQF